MLFNTFRVLIIVLFYNLLFKHATYLYIWCDSQFFRNHRFRICNLIFTNIIQVLNPKRQNNITPTPIHFKIDSGLIL